METKRVTVPMQYYDDNNNPRTIIIIRHEKGSFSLYKKDKDGEDRLIATCIGSPESIARLDISKQKHAALIKSIMLKLLSI